VRINKRFVTKEEAISWLQENGYWHYNSTPTAEFWAHPSSELFIVTLKKTAVKWTLKDVRDQNNRERRAG
jgi:hypothetical protein